MANGVYEIKKWRRNSKKQAATKIWWKITAPAPPPPPPDSSLGRFWRETHRRPGAAVLSLEERPPASVPLFEVHMLRQLSPPTSFAQRGS